MKIYVLDVISRWTDANIANIRNSLDSWDGSDNTLEIDISSPGGAVYEAFGMRGMLEEWAEKHPHVALKVNYYGLVASAATILAPSNAETRIHESATFMIHNPWSIDIGDSKELRKSAEQLDAIKEQMLDIYSKTSTLTRDDLSEAMDDETWYSAKFAVKYGFAGSKFGGKDSSKDASADARKRMFAVAAQFNRVSAMLPIIGSEIPVREQSMKSEEHMSNKNRETGTIVPDVNQFVPRAEYDALVAQLKEREESEKIRREEEFKCRVNATLDTAISGGLIAPADREYYYSSAVRGEDALRDLQAFLERKTPVLAKQPTKTDGEPTDSGVRALTPEQAKMAKQMGVSPEDFLATLKEIRRAEQEARGEVTNG